MCVCVCFSLMYCLLSQQESQCHQKKQKKKLWTRFFNIFHSILFPCFVFLSYIHMYWLYGTWLMGKSHIQHLWTIFQIRYCKKWYSHATCVSMHEHTSIFITLHVLCPVDTVSMYVWNNVPKKCLLCAMILQTSTKVQCNFKDGRLF